MTRSIARIGMLAAALALASCGSTKASPESDNASKPAATATAAAAKVVSSLTVAFLPKQLNNPYFTISDDGGKTAVEGLGAKFTRVGPSEATASSQVSYINTLTTQKVSAIV